MCTLWSRFWNNRQNFSFLKQPNSSIFSRYTEEPGAKYCVYSNFWLLLTGCCKINYSFINMTWEEFFSYQSLFLPNHVRLEEKIISSDGVQLCIAVKSEISFLISTFSLRSTCWFIDVFSNLTCNTSSAVHFIQLPPKIRLHNIAAFNQCLLRTRKDDAFSYFKKCNLFGMCIS